MPSRQKAKGYANEKKFADFMNAKRVYASGAGKHFDERLGEDVDLPNGWKVQVKAYASKWMNFYYWMGLIKSGTSEDGKADILAIRTTGPGRTGWPFLVVMHQDLFKKMYDCWVEHGE